MSEHARAQLTLRLLIGTAKVLLTISPPELMPSIGRAIEIAVPGSALV